MTKMLFALLTLCFLILNIDAATKKPEEGRNVPRYLYEEFFQLINPNLTWNATMAKDADRQLSGQRCYPQFWTLLVKRMFGYPFKKGEHVLLTLEKVFTTPHRVKRV
ncbi:hypothetical protein OSTOST_22406, partial [Ostertagia ostertagi]